MNINQKAIDAFERYEYEEALKLFRKAVQESRTIQSLNNLAWIYSYEECDDKKAFELIEEAIRMNPTSYFPYNILSEIYIRQEKWNLASETLLKSICLQPSTEAYYNLAAVKYHLGELREASDLFQQGAGDSDYQMYSHLKCLIDLGNKTEAKEKLDSFNIVAEDFVGEVEVADMYVELGCYEEAVSWFEKGWGKYSKELNWVSRFIYSLFQSENNERIYEVILVSIQQKEEEIRDVQEDECDEHWTEKDKETDVKKLLEEKNTYENVEKLISSGYIPLMEFQPSTIEGCYLFGCKRHNHQEY